MTITESELETYAIDLLKQQGYKYLSGPDIAPCGKMPLRKTLDDVVLSAFLEQAISRLNNNVPRQAQIEALSNVIQLHGPDLLSANESFHRMLIEGVTVDVAQSGQQRGYRVRLIDFDCPDNNVFHVIDQFTVSHHGRNKRIDVLLAVNGLPLVVIELKSPSNQSATLQRAFSQLQAYKQAVSNLLSYNSLLVIANGHEAKAGSISAEYNRFMAWKSHDGKSTIDVTRMNQMEALIGGALNRDTLLDLINNFTVFEKDKQRDVNTGVTTVTTIKKIAAYHQYYAVNKGITSVVRASAEQGDRKGGIIWHTQGAGKSLSMAFCAGKLAQSTAMGNPTIVIITDRNDLDEQLFDTFAASTAVLRQKPVQATDRQHLKKLLNIVSGGIVFTTIQKFQPEDEKTIFDELSPRRNIVVMVDEAHRTQYGFKARTLSIKNEEGEIVGQKVCYGFAKYLRDALPNATYLGFTGTPIEHDSDKNTPAVFGSYIDIYDIAQAVEDGATVNIYYESRLAKIELSDEGKRLVAEVDEKLAYDAKANDSNSQARWGTLEALVGSDQRIKQVAEDIVTHFESRQEASEGKAIIVVMSRSIAVKLYDAIINVRPAWHDDDLTKGAMKVVITSSSSDGPELDRHHTTKSQRSQLASRLKQPNDALQIAIVCDMWLTGFDAPCLNTLYIDKPMQGHNLMQAIARVNRVYQDKAGGLVVDYLGLASDLKKALAFYANNQGKGEPALEQEKAVEELQSIRESVAQMFHGFDYQGYFSANAAAKLNIIRDAEDHILGARNGRQRFVMQVKALARYLAIALPHDIAMQMKDEIAFFQAIKVRLMQLSDDTAEGANNLSIQTAMKQIIDKEMKVTSVVDVFSAAGIEKRDLSILSEEFLLDIQEMPQKNLAVETLKTLLKQELSERSRINATHSKTLLEKLDDAMNRYHNQMLTSVEVIEELIAMAKTLTKTDEERQKLNLSVYEYAFYDAVAENEDAKALLKHENIDIKALAIALTESIRKDSTLDWRMKDTVRANLRRNVKKILNRFGYPPQMSNLAIDNVIKQAESMAEVICSN